MFKDREFTWDNAAKIYVVCLGLIGLFSFIYEEGKFQTIGNLIIGTILVAMIGVRLKMEQKQPFLKSVLAGIIFTLLLFTIPMPMQLRPIIGAGMVVTLMTDFGTGLLVQIFYGVMVYLIGNDPQEVLLLYTISGVAACGLAFNFRKKELFFMNSVVIIVLNISLSVILAFIMGRDFSLQRCLFAFLSRVFSIIIVFIFFIAERVFFGKAQPGQLKSLCEMDSPLLLNLKNVSPHDYSHVRKVSLLARRGARAIGADEQLAGAGGFYIRIGRIQEGNYIEEGISIAKENHFPESIINIIEEQNAKSRIPTSVESAIVMLANTVVSTYEYLDQNGKAKDEPEKIINHIFQVRMERHLLDDSGMMVGMYYKLRDCFIQEERIYDISKRK